MYTFSSKLKTFSFILMAVGLLGIGYGFLSAPKNIQEVEAILAADTHGSAHGSPVEAHATTEESHVATDAAHQVTETPVSNKVADTATEAHDSIQAPASEAAHASTETHDVTGEDKVNADAEHKEHIEHVLHQLQNKPWAALYVACIFFMLISLGVLAFYAIQQVAQAGWSPVLFRVMQGITAYLPVGSVIFFIVLILCGLHFNHLFVWLDPEVVAHDKLIANKTGYLNFPFWIVRAAIFLIGWNLYRYYSR